MFTYFYVHFVLEKKKHKIVKKILQKKVEEIQNRWVETNNTRQALDPKRLYICVCMYVYVCIYIYISIYVYMYVYMSLICLHMLHIYLSILRLHLRVRSLRSRVLVA